MNDSAGRVALLGWSASAHIQKWARGLAGRGWKVRLYTPGGDKLPDIETVVLAGGRWSFLLSASGLRKNLDEFKPDLLHVHYAGGHSWLGSRSGYRPLVVSAWGADVIDLPRNPLLKPFVARVLRSADHVTTTSQMLKRHCLKLVPEVENRLTVIPFGVELPERVEKPPTGSFQLCYIKKHATKYGPLILIRAFGRLISEGLDMRLVMAGSGPLTPDLEDLVQKLGLFDRVKFVGQIDAVQVNQLLRESHVMVMPSVMESESFGVAALEASANSRAVVASRIGGVPEVVNHNVTGLLMPPDDEPALASSIRELYKDRERCSAMGKAGRKFVEEQYLWSTSLDRMIEVYEKIIEEKP